MKFKLTISLVVLFCLVSSFAHSQVTWKVFNHKNGFAIQLPSYFSTGLLVAGGTLQWFDNTFDKNIEIAVETFGNASPDSLQSEFDSEQKTFTKVTYKLLKPTLYVISGEDEQGISYLKTILKDGVLHHLRITYPETQRKLMDDWIPKISASFK